VKRDVQRAEAEHVRERSANAMAERRPFARNVLHTPSAPHAWCTVSVADRGGSELAAVENKSGSTQPPS
jgi:hypothetical protein